MQRQKYGLTADALVTTSNSKGFILYLLLNFSVLGESLLQMAKFAPFGSGRMYETNDYRSARGYARTTR